MKNTTFKNRIKITAVLALLAFAGGLVFINACNKKKECCKPKEKTTEIANAPTPTPIAQNMPMTDIVTIAAIRKSTDGTPSVVLLNKHERVYNVADITLLNFLDIAQKANTPIKITYDPWQGIITKAENVTSEDQKRYAQKHVMNNAASAIFSTEQINANPAITENLEAMGIINTTTPGLTNMIPDMATAQLMFNFLTKQCCALSGPYAIDYCISFQYCEDGCYARAHKMCYVINNKYHYATQKIFSFANSGSDELCVKGEKWGGCCINWWYHVAPLVTIKTPTGPKAFVFDPAMFDQPVLLTTWLHAQQNPACAGGHTPHVSMINVQPTTSYSPASYSGTTFDTDPFYADTDTTMVHYSTLLSCP